MFKISVKIAQKLLNTKLVSCLVTYFYIKELFSGKVRGEDLYVIAKERNLTAGVIRKHIGQLMELGFLEDKGTGKNNGDNWWFAIGNHRYNDLNFLEGRSAIIFDHIYDVRLGINSNLTVIEKLKSFEDLVKLRTYLHTGIQALVVKKYLKPILTPAQIEVKKIKDEHKRLKRKLKKLKKNNNNLENTNPIIEVENLLKSTDTDILLGMSAYSEYSASATYINQIVGTHQKGFSPSTVRKQRNKSVKFDMMDMKRNFNVLACTKEFRKYHKENFYIHQLDFNDSLLKNSGELIELYEVAEKPNNLYSPLFLWCNNPEKLKSKKNKVTFKRPGDILGNLGTVNALVQEVSPTVSYKISIGKFAKRKITYMTEYEKKKIIYSYNPKLVYNDVLPMIARDILDIEISKKTKRKKS